ncbi:tRNA pseudouridine(38-40) synthase TruA [Algibacter mikhailovii]|uniref:tRNA pseudouridine(38-40) synthase TruA n=1 Tax=Algibacter mikhailovii TaxID=425498 RepID=UPI002493F37A|nr:tRNA pseudouridine(38-40) synthase TruA [Algibacter mikhailovii]
MKKYYYVIDVQYLGYRFHGWQKQPNLKTLHLMVDRTFNYILEGAYFKTLVSGRTDAMVSAEQSAFELFLKEPIEDTKGFLQLFNHNLPQDIRALNIREVDKSFNIINHSKVKEYLYLFTYGEKCHPFCAPIMTTIMDDLDINLMKKGAKLFEGTNYLWSYCYKPTEQGIYTRDILQCELVENNIYQANYFPKQTYMLRVKGKGFMRNQIRLMMGTLIDLGKGDLTLKDIEDSLVPDSRIKMKYIAPASGLILNSVDFQ